MLPRLCHRPASGLGGLGGGPHGGTLGEEKVRPTLGRRADSGLRMWQEAADFGADVSGAASCRLARGRRATCACGGGHQPAGQPALRGEEVFGAGGAHGGRERGCLPLRLLPRCHDPSPPSSILPVELLPPVPLICCRGARGALELCWKLELLVCLLVDY